MSSYTSLSDHCNSIPSSRSVIHSAVMLKSRDRSRSRDVSRPIFDGLGLGLGASGLGLGLEGSGLGLKKH